MPWKECPRREEPYLPAMMSASRSLIVFSIMCQIAAKMFTRMMLQKSISSSCSRSSSSALSPANPKFRTICRGKNPPREPSMPKRPFHSSTSLSNGHLSAAMLYMERTHQRRSALVVAQLAGRSLARTARRHQIADAMDPSFPQ